MKYSINACRACINKFKDKDCNVNDINNCVYDVATAFVGRPSSNALNNFDYDDLRKQCSECVYKFTQQMGPFRQMTWRDKRINPPPVFANNPNYLPDLLETSNSVVEAKNKCIQLCRDNAVNSNECIENCIVQANAVEEYKPEISRPSQNNTIKKPQQQQTTTPAPLHYEGTGEVPWWSFPVFFIVATIIYITFLYLINRE